MNKNVNEEGCIYGTWEMWDNTWVIAYGKAVYCFLLIGEEKALLIDTAYGKGDIRALVESITDKPVYVANTHGHFDHTGGNALWEKVYGSREATKDMKKAFNPDMEAEMKRKPYPDYEIEEIGDGYSFELGNRRVEVIDIPAHHPGSVAYLDHGRRLLFSGDEMEAGQVLMFLDKKVTIPAHLENMKKLKKRGEEFDFICPSHNGLPLNKSYIDDFIGLDTAIMEGNQQVQENLAGFGFPPVMGSFFGTHMNVERAKFGKASMIYLK